jgi:hypothetical protein
MDRLVYVIESSKGYLYDIEKYTSNIFEAVTFVEYDTAVKKLATLTKSLVTECRVNMHCIPFPHPIGYQPLTIKP